MRLTRYAFAAALVAAASLSGCGGSGSRGGGGTAGAVVTVAGTPIARSAVSHWMSTLAGGEYNELSRGHVLPEGLVSDPANETRCLANLRAAIAKGGGPGGPESVLREKCQQMNTALKEQATSFLIGAQTLEAFAHQEGVTASEGAVREAFKRTRAQIYPTAADLAQYLSDTHASLADVMFRLKQDVLSENVSNALGASGKQPLTEYAKASSRYASQTSCSAGYVVHGCSAFKGTDLYPGTPPPAVLMEQLTKLVVGICINQAACAKQ